MHRSPLALAALATVAVPGLDAYDVRRPAHPTADVDTAIVLDAEARRWVVRAPHTARAGAALEAEAVLLKALVGHVEAGDLPFAVPRPEGFAHLPEGGRAVVHRQLPGRPLPLEKLGPGPGLAAAVGRAIGAVHELPISVVEDAGLPVYDAESYRQRRLGEVDAAARTGKVPPSLLRRWERALENVAMWRFQPTVVHGDLSAEHVLCSRTEPTGVLGWSEAKVADPADDLAWLLVAAPQEAIDPILEAYSLRRSELSDRHLADRALLAGELALARWLLHGVRAEDEAIVADATAMLVELDEHTAAADAAALAEATPPAPADPAPWTVAVAEPEAAEAEVTDTDVVEPEGAEPEVAVEPEAAAAQEVGVEPDAGSVEDEPDDDGSPEAHQAPEADEADQPR